jgi:Uma2 family endonuclease
MSLTARKLTRISAAEYLAAENDEPWRHEFVNGVRREFINGVVFAMRGPGFRHNFVRTNLAEVLHKHVTPGGRVCMAEVKLRIRSKDDERYYYPDVFVASDPDDHDPYCRSSASLVVEVLSPSTERIDRFEKFEAYKCIPALLEYGLLTQDAMELELFRRRTDWQREFYQRDNTVTFESVGLTINVSRLYRDIDFDDPAPPPET